MIGIQYPLSTTTTTTLLSLSRATMSHHRILLILNPSQGHINPAFQLAKNLAALGAHVTVSTTLYMHRRIANKPSLPTLTFLPFSDGYDHGYTFSSSDYSLYSSELSRRGSEFVRNLLLSNAQEGHPFTCVVYTTILSWAADVAREFHLPTALLWTQPATILDIFYYYFHGHRDSIDAKTKHSSSLIQFPGLPLTLSPSDLPSFLLGSNPTFDSLIVSMYEKQLLALDEETRPRILVNTFEALEPEALSVVEKLNMIPIGPLIPSAFYGKDPSDNSFGGDVFDLTNGYVEWLEKKKEMSVVYVSFGSYCVLSKAQMEEVARALLDCGRPFLWVVREKEELEVELELGLGGKGKIVTWCSQVEVLSHGAVGCFVTHCGWNSAMESLASGVPMVAFPLWVDQKTNAKLIEDVWKVGVRVDGEVNEEGVVQRERIREGLEVVMGSGERGEELRKNANKWKDLARDAVKQGGSSDNNLRAFLRHVQAPP